MPVKESKRALPFQSQAIRFGEACLIVESTPTFQPHALYESFEDTGNLLPSGTIIIPLANFKSWRSAEMVKCLIGGVGVEYILHSSPIEKLK